MNNCMSRININDNDEETPLFSSQQENSNRYRKGVCYGGIAFAFSGGFIAFIVLTVKSINKERSHCEEQQRQWVYLPETGQSACTDCGEWSRMPYSALFSPESCINTFLKTPRSLEELQKVFIDAAGRFEGKINKFDFSQQDWISWDVAKLEDILTKMAVMVKKPLVVFDLSQPTPHVLNLNQTLHLNEFLVGTATQKLKISRVTMGGNLPHILLNNTSVSNLDLTKSLRNADSVSSFTKVLPHMQQLNTLLLSSNNISDAQIETIAPIINMLNITSFSVDDNNFQSKGCESLLTSLPRSIRYFSISGNNLSKTNFTSLARIMPSLKSLILSNTDLEEEAMNTLASTLILSQDLDLVLSRNHLNIVDAYPLIDVIPEAHISKLDLSGNNLDDQFLVLIGDSLNNTKALHTLILDRNIITDNGLASFSSIVGKTPIKHFFVGENQLTDRGMIPMSDIVQNAQMFSVGLAGNSITDVGLSYLNGIWSNSSQSLYYLDLSNNRITAIGLNQIALDIKNNTILETLLLSHNFLGKNSNNAMVELLTGNQLKKIDLGYCLLNTPIIKNITKVIRNSTVREITLSGNEISDGVPDLASKLLFPSPNPNELAANELTTDQKQTILHAKPNSNITIIGLSDTGMNVSDALAFCRIVAPANISQFELSENSFNSTNGVDPITCWYGTFDQMRYQTSSASTLQPSFLVFHRMAKDLIPVNSYRLNREQFQSHGLSFLNVLNGIMQESQLIPSSKQLFDCLAAGALAFHQEIYQVISPFCPKWLQPAIPPREAHFLKEMTGLSLRSAYPGAPSFVFDVTKITKKTYQQHSLDSQKYTKDLASGLLPLVLMYGASLLLGQVTGYSSIAFLLFPLIFNGNQIKTRVSKAYNEHGFFGAANEVLEGVARSAPGARYIMGSKPRGNKK